MLIRREIIKVLRGVSEMEINDKFDIFMKDGRILSAMVTSKDSHGVTCIFTDSVAKMAISDQYKYSMIRDLLKTMEWVMPDNLHDIMMPVYGKSEVLRLPVAQEMTDKWKDLNKTPSWTLNTGNNVFGTRCYYAIDEKGKHLIKSSNTKLDVKPMFRLKADGDFSKKITSEKQTKRLANTPEISDELEKCNSAKKGFIKKKNPDDVTA